MAMADKTAEVKAKEVSSHYALFMVNKDKINEESVGDENSTQEGEMAGIGGNSPAVCYYVLLPSQALVCLLAVAEANLEVFRPELARFCEKLEPHIKEQSASDLLSKWHVKCVQYVGHILEELGPDIAALLQLVQQNGGIKVEGKVPASVEADIQQFLMACSVSECLVGAPPGVEAIVHMRPGATRKVCVMGVQANAYCTDWARLLLELGPSAEPWRLRKLLEAFKLKTIKDMNILKRLLKQAETDHYFLYRAYAFLWQSGNSDILLRQAALEGSSSPDVLSVLEEHLSGCGSSPIPVTTRV
ncbi:Protein Njmu-R1 [Gryllus bimaculatus]|nr:Protein Njmu-R1 [Gryllus bimaculatus]